MHGLDVHSPILAIIAALRYLLIAEFPPLNTCKNLTLNLAEMVALLFLGGDIDSFT